MLSFLGKRDVTMWDNKATWHKAVNDGQGYHHYMHRITVDGCGLKPSVRENYLLSPSPG
jgi:alpha-ketoglutarate-dependent taurine dioxygenase